MYPAACQREVSRTIPAAEAVTVGAAGQPAGRPTANYHPTREAPPAPRPSAWKSPDAPVRGW